MYRAIHPDLAWRGKARVVLRHTALDVLSTYGRMLDNIRAALSRPRISFPYLHGVPQDREWALRELLFALAPTHTFISYSEAIRRLHHGPIDKPYVAFSFDDGFKSNVRCANILEEFGAVGCFFVPAQFVGTSSIGASRDFFGFNEYVDEPAMTWGDLEELKSRGHEVENHTVNHQVLSWVSEAQAAEEIAGAAGILRQRLGGSKHFAWPRGRFHHFDPKAARAVFESGHESCASAERGAHTAVVNGPIQSLCIRRDHIMAEWPTRHSLYFLAASSAKSTPAVNGWPDDWVINP